VRLGLMRQARQVDLGVRAMEVVGKTSGPVVGGDTGLAGEHVERGTGEGERCGGEEEKEGKHCGGEVGSFLRYREDEYQGFYRVDLGRF
jgi:hypothetical protein